MTDKDILKIKQFMQFVIDHPLSFDNQEVIVRDGYKWCQDWWTVEIGKFLINGEEIYKIEPPPHRLKDNPLWSKEKIIRDGDFKLSMMKLLQENKDFADTLFSCEVGRGTDVLLASFIKSWKRIIGNDANPLVLEQANSYIKNKLELPLETFTCNSDLLDFSVYKEKMIIVGNLCRINPQTKEYIKSNPNLLAILNGEILK